jgi:flagellin
MNANKNLAATRGRLSSSSEKLSSGYRINRSADDTAGLSISEKMRKQVRGSDRASLNAREGVSLLNVADGALQEDHDLLHRMRELVVQGANDTNTTEDRAAIGLELQHMAKEIDRIADATNYNTRELLKTKDGKEVPLQLQVGHLAHQNVDINIHDMSFDFSQLFNVPNPMSTLMLDDVDRFANASHEDIAKTLNHYEQAIRSVSQRRTYFGSVSNRLEHTVSNLETSAENTQAAESRIRDTNMAMQMVDYSKENILQQSGQAVLAQANQSAQGIMTILGG